MRKHVLPMDISEHKYASAQLLAAEMLGEDEDWRWDVANEMDQEDGLIWVYGLGDHSVLAFTDFGIETLTGLSDLAAVYAEC